MAIIIHQISPVYTTYKDSFEEHGRNIGERSTGEHEVNVFTIDLSCRFTEKERVNGVMIRRMTNFSPNDPYHISFEIFRELIR